MLGDDINIFDEKVAHQYLAIMASIGVPINLSKSVVASNATFEFAKVTGHHGENVSAVSWKMFISQPTMMGRVNILYSLLNKGIVPAHLGHWMRSVLAKTWNVQGNIGFSYIALCSMFAKSGRLPYKDLLGALIIKSNKKDGVVSIPRKLSASAATKMTNISYIESLLVSIVKGTTSDRVVNKVAVYEETLFKNNVFNKLVAFLTS